MSRMSRILDFTEQKDELLTYPPPQLPPPSSSSSSSSSSSGLISPAILLSIVILAAIFFVSGLIHLFVRFFTKRRSSSIYLPSSTGHPESSSSASQALQRQLQTLFRLHDSGLDQTAIDALPLFFYKHIIGLKEPFDCAVCLCEFSDQDKLRLLPSCSHAFHIHCIDTWLLSNSSCPLCRGTLAGSVLETQILDIIDEETNSAASVKRVFSVRLGKYFRSFNSGRDVRREEEEGSGRYLDSRRCYSMGSYQYIVGDLDLQVEALSPLMSWRSRVVSGEGRNVGNNKRINGGRCRRGESFSISKIWLWPKNSRFCTSSSNMPSQNVTMQNDFIANLD